MSKHTLSVNNILIVRPYDRGQGIKQTVSSGFATVTQKTDLVGLELLTHAVIDLPSGPTTYPIGSVAYFREDELMSAPWAKEVRKCDAVEGPFLIVEFKKAVLIATQV